MTHDHIHKALRQNLRPLTPGSAKLLRIYRAGIGPMYRAVRGWLDLTVKAINYGVTTQMIQGRKPLLETLTEYESWDGVSPVEKALAIRRANEFAKSLSNRIGDAPLQKAVPFTNIIGTIVDWSCIRMEGDRRWGTAQVNIYGDAMGVAGQIAKVPFSFDVVNEHAVKWAAQHVGNRVQDVTAEMQKALQDIVSQGIKDGKSMGTIGREMRPHIGLNQRQSGALTKYEAQLKKAGIKPARARAMVEREGAKKLRYRAEMIARSETAEAVSRGTIEGYGESGVQYVIFEASADACIECSFRDNDRLTLAESAGIIPVHPNCRCSWRPDTKTIERPEAPPVAEEAAEAAVAPTKPPTRFSSGNVVSHKVLKDGGVNVSSKVHIGGDGDGIFKPISGEESYGYYKKGTLAGREVAAKIVDQEMGFGFVPETTIKSYKGEIGSVQKWVRGLKAWSPRQTNLQKQAIYTFETSAKGALQKEQMATLDLLIANSDRHGGNYLYRHVGTKAAPRVNKIVAIDHGYAFPTNAAMAEGEIGASFHFSFHPDSHKMPATIKRKLKSFVKRRKEIAKRMEDYISPDEIKSVFERAEVMIEHSDEFTSTPSGIIDWVKDKFY